MVAYFLTYEEIPNARNLHLLPVLESWNLYLKDGRGRVQKILLLDVHPVMYCSMPPFSYSKFSHNNLLEWTLVPEEQVDLAREMNILSVFNLNQMINGFFMDIKEASDDLIGWRAENPTKHYYNQFANDASTRIDWSARCLNVIHKYLSAEATDDYVTDGLSLEKRREYLGLFFKDGWHDRLKKPDVSIPLEKADDYPHRGINNG